MCISSDLRHGKLGRPRVETLISFWTWCGCMFMVVDCAVGFKYLRNFLLPAILVMVIWADGLERSGMLKAARFIKTLVLYCLLDLDPGQVRHGRNPSTTTRSAIHGISVLCLMRQPKLTSTNFKGYAWLQLVSEIELTSLQEVDHGDQEAVKKPMTVRCMLMLASLQPCTQSIRQADGAGHRPLEADGGLVLGMRFWCNWTCV